MKNFYKIIALVGLILTLAPSLLFYFDVLDMEGMKLYMALGTLLWFSGAIPWLGQKKTQN